MLSSCNMLRMIWFKYNAIITVIFSHSDLSVHSKQYNNHIENIIRFLFFICCCLSGHWSIKLEYHSMIALAEKQFDGCNSIVYFVITIKGTGEEPESLRWMAFSFSNLMAFSLPSVPVCQSSKSGGIYQPHPYFKTAYYEGNECTKRCQLTTFKLNTLTGQGVHVHPLHCSIYKRRV